MERIIYPSGKLITEAFITFNLLGAAILQHFHLEVRYL